MKVIVLSGISGSGKSTLARKLWNDLGPGRYCKVVSADDFFLQKYGSGREEYKFEPAKLGLAHASCMKKFVDTLYAERGLYDLLIVDNTNLSAEEISPYILVAQAFGVECEVMTLQVPFTSENVTKLSDRNLHGVSPNAVANQFARLEARKLPPYWKHTTVTPDGNEVGKESEPVPACARQGQ